MARRSAPIAAILLAACCAMPISCPAVPKAIEQMRSTADFVKQMESGAIAKLGLAGKTGLAAIQAMLSEAYRCGIEPAVEWPRPPGSSTNPFSTPAGIGCVKEMEPGVCGTFSLTIGVRWHGQRESVADLYDELERSPVVNYSGLCLPRAMLPDRYLTERKAAEGRLAASLAELKTSGRSLDSVFRSMLIEGFQCGLASEGPRQRMRCTRMPSKTQYCYQEEALFDVGWPDAEAPLPKRVLQMSKAKTLGVQAVCGLPEMSGDAVAEVAPVFTGPVSRVVAR